MTNHTTILEAVITTGKRRLNQLDALIDSYKLDKIECTIDYDASGHQLDINIYTDHERERVLAQTGEVFGKTGWTAFPSSGLYHWTKEVKGVRIRIYQAQPIPQMSAYQVDPKQFPVLLEDRDSDDCV